MANERKVKSPEEREAELREALARIRPQVSKKSVLERVTAMATRPDEPSVDNTKTTAKKKQKKPMGLNEMGRQNGELTRRAQKEGIELSHPTKDKDDKGKKKDKDKENTPEKQEAKMKEMFAKIKLPSGMEIRQEGPRWNLYSQDGKQCTDVTDVMNTIDKFNRNVDTANEQNRMQNAAQSSADKAADVHKGNEITPEARVSMVEHALPNVTVAGPDGQPIPAFKQEDIRTIAETAINFSNEKALLERLKDPKALEEMRRRNNRNEQNAEAARRQLIDNQLRNDR